MCRKLAEPMQMTGDYQVGQIKTAARDIKQQILQVKVGKETPYQECCYRI